MSYLTDFQYYNNEDQVPKELNWGSYQYTALNDIVRNFMLFYVGNDKLINNVMRQEVRFHAKRAIQELNYDALREVKIVELSVCDNLQMVLPYDFVNWVRISLYVDGVMYPLQQNQSNQFAISHLQDNDCNILLDEQGNVLLGTSLVDYDRITQQKRDIYLGDSRMSGKSGYLYNGSWFFDYTINNKRFGLNTSTANVNPTFSINKSGGYINFSSDLLSYNEEGVVILEYISDGMEKGDDSNVVVNKLFEEYVYSWIEYQILRNKAGIQRYHVREKRNLAFANLQNAKIRIADIKPERLLQTLRGRSKWLK